MQIDLAALPSDPALLQQAVRELAATLTTRNAEVERLRALIKQLQRSHFGRARSNSTRISCSSVSRISSRPSLQSLPPRRRLALRPRRRPLAHRPDATAAHCRRTCRGSRSWSTSRTRPARAAAGRCTSSARTTRSARRRPGAVSGEGDPPAALRLPGLRGCCGSGARTGAADGRRGWPPRRCSRRCWSASLPIISPCLARLRASPARISNRSLHSQQLGRPGLLVARAALRTPAGEESGLDQDLRRRHAAPGARSGRGSAKTGRL